MAVSPQYQVTPYGMKSDYASAFKEWERRPYNFREFVEAEVPGYDGAMTTDDLTFLMPEVINRQIITIAEDARIGRNLIDVMKINGDSESFLKEYGFEAFRVEETGEVPVAKPRHEKEFIEIFKFGVRPLLSYEAMADGKIPILRRNILNATLAMARFEDAHIMTVLNAGVPNGGAIKGTNEEDHSFAAASNALTWDLLVRSYTSIVRENLTPTDIVCHPFQMNQFLKMIEFRQHTAKDDGTQAATPAFGIWNNRTEMAYGSGKIGQILGCNVWVTNNQEAGVMLMLDRKNYGILAERQPLLVESEDDIVHQMHTVVFTQRLGAGIINNDGAANITGLLTTNA